MIAALGFGDLEVRDDGRAVRSLRFEPRSTLPLSAACVVANGARETLSRMLARPIEVDVIEPAIPAADARRIVLRDAFVQRVRGRVCDAFVIVRPLDARRLVASAYGESERRDDAPLSEIEGTTLERIVTSLVPLCVALCGDIRSSARETPERALHDCATYFEVRALGASSFAIGFALSADPREAVEPQLHLDDLADLELPVRAIFARGAVAVPAFARLSPGALLRLDTPLGAPGILEIGGVRFGRVVCGVRGTHAAVIVGAQRTDTETRFERGAA
jgi:flagellar motor switch/type III secretory pathway protein FliN